MKKVMIECTQQHTYRRVVEVEDSDYEVLIKLEKLYDVGMWNNPEAFQLLEDIICPTDDLFETEQEYGSVMVTDVNEEK